MTLTDFQNKLREILMNNYLAERTDSNNLMIWFLENVFDLDKDLATSYVCDGKKDKGIDAIYVDQMEEIIYIFQSKFKENNGRQIGDKVLRDFSGVKEWFKTPETVLSLKNATINAELKSLITELKLNDIISDYAVEYHFVSNALSNHDTKEYLDVNDKTYIWDVESLNKYYHLTKDDPLVIDKHTFNDINEEKLILFELKNKTRTASFPIKASDILKLKGIQDLTLFNKNVRYGLGNTRVNKSIKKTLQNENEKENFLLFHNGISLVCEKYGYKDNELWIENYSIVNGAQSILSFHNNDTYLNDNVIVLLKIIEVGTNPDLMNQISKYNNNQNSISMRDLRSNDKIQNRLTREFEELDKEFGLKVIYSAKKGKSIESDYIELTSDYSGQLIEACYLFRPHYTHLKTSMFDSRYSEVFNKNSKAVRLLLYFNTHLKLKSILDKIEDKGIGDYGLAQFFLIMCLHRFIDSESDIKAYLNRNNNYINQLIDFDNAFETILSIIIKVFNKEMRENKKEDTFVYKNFFKTKDNIEKTYENIKALFDSLLELENKELKTIFEENNIRI
jgi:AIPR protein